MALGGIGFMEGLLGHTMSAVGKAAYYTAKGAWHGLNVVGTPVARASFALGTPVAKAATTGALHTGAFALRHPEMAMTAAAGGVGLYALSQTGAQEGSMSEKEVAYLARSMGGPSTGFEIGYGSMAYDPQRMAFIESASGLTLGLHRGRHG